MFKKISALILSGVLLAEMTTAYAELPAQQTITTEAQYYAGASEWNGKAELKAGKSYVVTKDVTISKAVTLPKGAKLTVKNGAKLTIGKNGALTVKGTLTINKKSTLAVKGSLTVAKSKKLVVSGNVIFAKTAKVKLNGKITINKTGRISGEPKSLSVGSSAKITANSKITSEKLYKEYDKAYLTDMCQSECEMVFVEGNYYGLLESSFPKAMLERVKEDTEKQLEEYAKELEAMGYEDGEITFEEYLDSVCEIIVALASMEFDGAAITGIEPAGDISIEYMDISELNLDENSYAEYYGDIERAADVTYPYVFKSGDQTSDVTSMGGVCVYSGGKWYFYFSDTDSLF